MKDKLYLVNITRSQTLSILLEDKSATSAVARANLYAYNNEQAFADKPYEITKRSTTLVRDIVYDPVDVDVDLTGERWECPTTTAN